VPAYIILAADMEGLYCVVRIPFFGCSYKGFDRGILVSYVAKFLGEDVEFGKFDELRSEYICRLYFDGRAGSDNVGVHKVDVDSEDLGVVFRQPDETFRAFGPVPVHGATEELGASTHDAFMDGEMFLGRFLPHDYH
jgi:hypothetical protein